MTGVDIRGTTLGSGRAKVIVPLTARTPQDLVAQAQAVRDSAADLTEWRIDLMAGADEATPARLVGWAVELRAAAGELPVVLTYRTVAEGGEGRLGPEAYAALVAALAASRLVDAVDVEAGCPLAEDIVEVAHDARVPVIGSRHWFTATPPAEEIARTLESMFRAGADVAKVAVMPRDARDVATLLAATAEVTRTSSRPVVTMAMGGLGLVTRLATQAFGGCATFARLGEGSAPGQIDLAQVLPIVELVARELEA